MKLFTRRMRLFCVSNLMVSFVCTGFLGINGYNQVIESPKENAREIALTANDTEPVSHNGEDEKRDYLALADIANEEIKTGSVNTIIGDTNKKAAKKTTNVVTKKEVKKTVTYAPASYSSVTGDAIVSYAKKYLGLKYKTGTPSLSSGADCSGFTMLIFREFGVSLPRTVSGQMGRGTYINKKDLQKGDLVFYSQSSRKSASHVAIYIGGGQVIHESRPGVGVKISSVNMMHYVTARRVINSKAKEIAEQKLAEEKQKETETDTSSTTNNNTNTENTTNINNESNVNNNNVVVNNDVNTNTNTNTVTSNNTTPTTPETPKTEVTDNTSTEESN